MLSASGMRPICLEGSELADICHTQIFFDLAHLALIRERASTLAPDRSIEWLLQPFLMLALAMADNVIPLG